MKRICLLLSGFIMFCGWLGAQNDKISFNKTDHDYGVVGDKNGPVYFDFIFTNNTDAPIVVTHAAASCGCTSPIWEKEPVEPKKTGKITAIYTPSNRGSFAKNITVHFSQGQPVNLTIRGEVVDSESIVKPKTPEEEYPVALGSYRLKTKELKFAQVELNQKKTIRLEVFNNSDKQITQKIFKLPKQITVEFSSATIPAKTAATVDVNLNVQDNKLYGNLSDEFILSIDGVKHSFPFTAIVQEDFSKLTAVERANSGKININSSDINFGDFSTGNSRILKIANSGKSSLNIRTIKSSDPSITVVKPPLSINPGEIAEIKIVVDSKKFKPDSSPSLTIITDDPGKPIVEIAVKANKKS